MADVLRRPRVPRRAELDRRLVSLELGDLEGHVVGAYIATHDLRLVAMRSAGHPPYARTLLTRRENEASVSDVTRAGLNSPSAGPPVQEWMMVSRRSVWQHRSRSRRLKVVGTVPDVPGRSPLLGEQAIRVGRGRCSLGAGFAPDSGARSVRPR